MVAEKKYYDYNYTSTAPLEEVKRSVKTNTKVLKKSKIHAKTILYILAVFVLFMATVYRTNLITEKNMSVIKLKSELESVDSKLAHSKIKLEQNTNVKEIEAYAKQKLGMQKPDKNQIVYVDSSKQSSVIVKEDATFFDKVLNKANEFIKKIF